MSEADSTSELQQYEQRWEDLLAQEGSYYTPEKYQLGLVADFLKQHGVSYTTEGEVFCYPIDVLGVKRGTTIAIELKSRNIKKGIQQAQRNTDFVDYSFLSVWENRATETLLSKVEDLDIGLLAVDDDISVYSGPEKTSQSLCKRSNIIETILNDVRGNPPIQQ